jgi:Ca2+-binding EF-hand superfamily protein
MPPSESDIRAGTGPGPGGISSSSRSDGKPRPSLGVRRKSSDINESEFVIPKSSHRHKHNVNVSQPHQAHGGKLNVLKAWASSSESDANAHTTPNVTVVVTDSTSDREANRKQDTISTSDSQQSLTLLTASGRRLHHSNFAFDNGRPSLISTHVASTTIENSGSISVSGSDQGSSEMDHSREPSPLPSQPAARSDSKLSHRSAESDDVKLPTRVSSSPGPTVGDDMTTVPGPPAAVYRSKSAPHAGATQAAQKSTSVFSRMLHFFTGKSGKKGVQNNSRKGEFFTEHNPFLAPVDKIREEENELLMLARLSHFDIEQVRVLQNVFYSMLELPVEALSVTQLANHLGLSRDNNMLAHALYSAFDVMNLRRLTFRGFLLGLSSMTKECNPQERAKWLFRMVDVHNTGHVTADDAAQLLRVCLSEMNSDVGMSEQDIQHLCEYTIAQANAACLNQLSESEFVTFMTTQSPSVLHHVYFTIDPAELHFDSHSIQYMSTFRAKTQVLRSPVVLEHLRSDSNVNRRGTTDSYESVVPVDMDNLEEHIGPIICPSSEFVAQQRGPVSLPVN